MKIRFYCLSLFLIITIFLIWQIILIFSTIIDSLRGINTHSVDQQLNKTTRKIPLIIHQMWKTTNLSTYPIKNSHLKWKSLYPNYQIYLWTDEQIEELILNAEYKFLCLIYKSYSYPIQRADLGRLIILHSYGGIYADLDVYPYGTNIEKLLLKNASLIVGRSSSDISLINHFFICEKHSSIIMKILQNFHRKTFFNRIYLFPYLEVFSTGSTHLTNILRNSPEQRLMILSNDELSEYVYHDAGRSWHLWDGYLINQMDAYPEKFLIFIFIFFISSGSIVFILYLIKYNRLWRIL